MGLNGEATHTHTRREQRTIMKPGQKGTAFTLKHITTLTNKYVRAKGRVRPCLPTLDTRQIIAEYQKYVFLQQNSFVATDHNFPVRNPYKASSTCRTRERFFGAQVPRRPGVHHFTHPPPPLAHKNVDRW